MPGASDQTRRVARLNANWTAGPDGDDGRFQLQVITDDEQHHVLAPSPAAVTALAALPIPTTPPPPFAAASPLSPWGADPVLAWDPTNRTLIAANLVGVMPWTDAS